jgi:hypothetical protein
VTFNGGFTWKSGRMVGAGKTIVGRAVELRLTGNEPKHLGRVLENGGRLVYEGTNLLFGPDDNALGTLRNLSGGVMEWVGEGDITHWHGGSHLIENRGTLIRSGPGVTHVMGGQIRFDNQGRLQVQEGTLQLEGAVLQHEGSELNGGTWEIGDGATLVFNQGSSIATNSATVLLRGPGSRFDKIAALATNQGRFILDAGREFTTVGSLANSGLLELGSGTVLQLGDTGLASLQNLATGRVTGTGTIKGNVLNAGGLAPGAPIGSLVIEGNYAQDSSGQLDVDVKGAADQRYDTLTISGTASLNGTLLINLVDGYVPPMNQTFAVLKAPTVQGSFARISGAGFRRSPSATGFTLRFGPTVLWDGGGGDFRWENPLNWSTDELPGPSDDVFIDVAPSATFTLSQGPVTINSLLLGRGTLALTANLQVNQASIQPGATLTGSAAFIATGPMIWSGGAMSGAGRTEARDGMTLTGSDTKTLDKRTLNLAGKTLWSQGEVSLANGAVIDLAPEAFLEIQSAQITGQGTINNRGRLTLLPAAAFSTLDQVTFNSSGIIDVRADTLTLGGAGGTLSGQLLGLYGEVVFLGLSEQGAKYQLDGLTGSANLRSLGATVEVTANGLTTSGYFTNEGEMLTIRGRLVAQAGFASPGSRTILEDGELEAGSVGLSFYYGELRGAGTVRGKVTNDGVFDPGSLTAAGTIRIEGDYVQAANGTLVIDLKQSLRGASADWLAITGKATLNGTLKVVLPAGSAPVGQYQIVTFASRDGDFRDFTWVNIAPEVQCTKEVGATAITITVQAPPITGALFTNPVLELPGWASATALADFNRDGKMDLMVAYRDRIAILRGDGSGAFGEPIDYRVDSSDRLDDALLADVNGDGALDIVFASNGSAPANRYVGVLLGAADGTFRRGSTTPLDHGPHTLAAGDVNGDGVLDLVTGNYGVAGEDPFGQSHYYTDVSVLVGNTRQVQDKVVADGTFRSPTYYNVRAPGTSVVLADLDRVVGVDTERGSDAYAISVLLNRGNGEFSGRTELSLGVKDHVVGGAFVAVADVNGDAVPDILAGGLKQAGVGVYLNNGRGEFPFADRLVMDLDYYITALETPDLNNDNRADLIAGISGPMPDYGTSASGVIVHLSRASGGLGAGELRFGPLAVSTLAVADIDGGGVLDLAALHQPEDKAGYSALSVLLNAGDGRFAVWRAPVPVGGNPAAVVAADATGDAIPDLIAGHGAFPNLSWHMNAGDASFGSAEPLLATNAAEGVIDCATGDLNNDGILDLVTANAVLDVELEPLVYSGESVSVLLGCGNGTFAPAVTYQVAPAPMAVALALVNDDRYLDIVTVHDSAVGEPDVTILFNRGDGTFAAAGRVALTTGYKALDVAVADINLDGWADLVLAGYPLGQEGDTLNVMLGKGGGAFMPPVSINVINRPRAVALVDVTRDAYPDIVAAGGDYPDGWLVVLKNNKEGGFEEQFRTNLPGEPSAVLGADVDGDKLADLLVTEPMGGVTFVLRQKSDGSFGPREAFAVGLGARSLVLADFNGDYAPDFATANTLEATVMVQLNLEAWTYGPVTWDGGGGDRRWLNPLNWSRDTLPTFDDDVVIADVPGDLTVVVDGAAEAHSLRCDESVELVGGQLHVAGEARLKGNLTWSGGDLGADLTVRGTTTWTGGRLVASMLRCIGPLLIDGPNAKAILQGTLSIESSAVWRGTGDVEGYFGAGVNIQRGATFEIATDALMYTFEGDSLYISNAGTLRSATTGTPGLAVVKNTGLIEVTAGTLGIESLWQTEGTLRLAGGNLTSFEAILLDGGRLEGSGTIYGGLVNHGKLALGSPLGSLNIQGDFWQERGGRLEIELGGTSANAYDTLTISGTAYLDAALEIRMLLGYTPKAGDTFRFLTADAVNGDFATRSGLLLANGLRFVEETDFAGVTLRVEELDEESAASETRDKLNAGLAQVWTGLTGLPVLFDLPHVIAPDGQPLSYEIPVLPANLDALFGLTSKKVFAGFGQPSLALANSFAGLKQSIDLALANLRAAYPFPDLLALDPSLVSLSVSSIYGGLGNPSDPAYVPPTQGEDLIRLDYRWTIPRLSGSDWFNNTTFQFLDGLPELSVDELMSYQAEARLALDFGVDLGGFYLLPSSGLQLRVQGGGDLGSVEFQMAGTRGTFRGLVNVNLVASLNLPAASPRIYDDLTTLAGQFLPRLDGAADLDLSLSFLQPQFTFSPRYPLAITGSDVTLGALRQFSATLKLPGFNKIVNGMPSPAAFNLAGTLSRGAWSFAGTGEPGALYDLNGFRVADLRFNVGLDPQNLTGIFSGRMPLPFGDPGLPAELEFTANFNPRSLNLSATGQLTQPVIGNPLAQGRPLVWIDRAELSMNLNATLATGAFTGGVTVNVNTAVVLPELPIRSNVVPDGPVTATALVGSLTASGRLNLQCGTLTLRVGRALLVTAQSTASAPAAGLVLDPAETNPAGTIMTVAQATVTAPDFPAVPPARLENLVIRRTGFSLGSFAVGSEQGANVRVAEVLQATGLRVRAVDIDYDLSAPTALSGRIEVLADSITLLPDQPHVASRVEGFTGTYDLATGAKSLTLSATSVELIVGATLRIQAHSTYARDDPGTVLQPAAMFSLAAGPVVRLANAQVSLPAFAAMPVVEVNELLIDRTGLSIASLTFGGATGVNTTFTDGSRTILEIMGLRVTGTNLVIPKSGDISGQLTVEATSAKLFPLPEGRALALLEGTESGLRGTLDLNAASFTLTIPKLSARLAEVIVIEATGVSFAHHRQAGPKDNLLRLTNAVGQIPALAASGLTPRVTFTEFGWHHDGTYFQSGARLDLPNGYRNAFGLVGLLPVQINTIQIQFLNPDDLNQFTLQTTGSFLIPELTNLLGFTPVIHVGNPDRIGQPGTDVVSYSLSNNGAFDFQLDVPSLAQGMIRPCEFGPVTLGVIGLRNGNPGDEFYVTLDGLIVFGGYQHGQWVSDLRGSLTIMSGMGFASGQVRLTVEPGSRLLLEVTGGLLHVLAKVTVSGQTGDAARWNGVELSLVFDLTGKRTATFPFLDVTVTVSFGRLMVQELTFNVGNILRLTAHEIVLVSNPRPNEPNFHLGNLTVEFLTLPQLHAANLSDLDYYDQSSTGGPRRVKATSLSVAVTGFLGSPNLRLATLTNAVLSFNNLDVNIDTGAVLGGTVGLGAASSILLPDVVSGGVASVTDFVGTFDTNGNLTATATNLAATVAGVLRVSATQGSLSFGPAATDATPLFSATKARATLSALGKEVVLEVDNLKVSRTAGQFTVDRASLYTADGLLHTLGLGGLLPLDLTAATASPIGTGPVTLDRFDLTLSGVFDFSIFDNLPARPIINVGGTVVPGQGRDFDVTGGRNYAGVTDTFAVTFRIENGAVRVQDLGPIVLGFAGLRFGPVTLDAQVLLGGFVNGRFDTSNFGCGINLTVDTADVSLGTSLNVTGGLTANAANHTTTLALTGTFTVSFGLPQLHFDLKNAALQFELRLVVDEAFQVQNSNLRLLGGAIQEASFKLGEVLTFTATRAQFDFGATGAQPFVTLGA